MKQLTKKQKEYFDNTGVNPIEEKKHSIKYYNIRMQIEKNSLARFINLLKQPKNKYYEMLNRGDWDLQSICLEIKESRNSIKEYRKAKAVYVNGTFWENVKESA